MSIRERHGIALFFVALIAAPTSSTGSPAPVSAEIASANPLRTQAFESKPFVIDQIYPSMKGPREVARVSIGERSADELLWVLSYQTEIVDAASGRSISDEFMCHNNVNVPNVSRHRRFIGAGPIRSAKRLFTLSQGVMKVEFPQGFGIPFRSGEPILLNTQVLNLNPIDQELEVRYRTTVQYVRESELVREIKPLYQFGVMGLKLLQGDQGYPGESEPDAALHGESCSVGEIVEGVEEIHHNDGQTYTNHWVVEPGREENHTLVTSRLGLKQDATAHYIAVHLHPFAESLELRDLTANKTVFKAQATNRKDRIGLEHVESYSSVEGTKLYKDHEYSLISIYQNDSATRQDAMASMFLYILDTAFGNKP